MAKGRRGGSNGKGGQPIEFGMSGVLFTCFRNYEAKCTTEAYDLLGRVVEVEVESTSAVQPGSVEAEIAAEVASLTTRKDKRFLAVGVNEMHCMAFIKTDRDEPCNLATELMKAVVDRRIGRVKFCQRIIPIQTICAAEMDAIVKAATPLLEQTFGGEDPIPWGIVYESRLNQSLDRDTVIKTLAALLPPRHPVNLSYPQVVLMLQVWRGQVGISVIRDYSLYRKFNVQELIKKGLNPKQETERKEKPGENEEADEENVEEEEKAE